MSHGARIAMLGIPSGEDVHRLAPVISTLLTVKGIYGREMYETWYKMTVMLPIRPGHHTGDHPPLPLHRIREGLRSHALRQFRQVVLSWE